MKLNWEKIVFYLMLVVVSGSIGYAIKPEPQVDQKVLEQNMKIKQEYVLLQYI